MSPETSSAHTRSAHPAPPRYTPYLQPAPPTSPLTEGGWPARVKRGIDIAGAMVGLALAAPIILVLVLLVKLDSRGPAIFTQTRVGLRGRTFRMLKLRTMREDAE